MYDSNAGRRPVLRLSVIAALAALALLAVVGSAGANGRYADKTGDSGSAPDISAAEVSSDSAGQLTFQVSAANVTGDVAVGLFIDSDANPASGNVALGGVDYFFIIFPSERAYDFGRWTGGDWDFDTPSSTVRVTAGSSGYAISVNRSELSNTSQVNFVAMTLAGGGGDAKSDLAPDNGLWNYDLAAAGPDIREILLQAAPANGPSAGKKFAVVVTGIRLPQTNVTDTVQPESYSCTATLAGRQLKGTGTGGCTYAIPKKKARGKQLVVNVSVAYEGATKTQSLTYRVKK
jgi:hypothetical protein